MAADETGDPPGQHRADHEKLAMRDIDHAHHAEDKRQAERHQRQHRGCDKSLEKAKNKIGTEFHVMWLAPLPPERRNQCEQQFKEGRGGPRM